MKGGFPMALPQDKPNPVPPWAQGLKAGSPPSTVHSAPADHGSPSPEYSIAVAAYVHNAVAHAMDALAEGIRTMDTKAEPRAAMVNIATFVARYHRETAAKLEEQTR